MEAMHFVQKIYLALLFWHPSLTIFFAGALLTWLEKLSWAKERMLE
jgi:menaquinone-dependent protoporphyrinogen IX oxidase